MAITRQQFEYIRRQLGAHTSWAVWSPQGDKPKSNVGDLSIFTDEQKISDTLKKLNPNIVLAGLNGSNGDLSAPTEVEAFANFHSNWSKATDFKIRYATEGTALEGAFMTDVIKHHYETDSNKVGEFLKLNPYFEKSKVEEFFDEITIMSDDPKIFAFGNMAYRLIEKYNGGRFQIYRLYHYAFTMSKERFREDVLKVVKLSGI